MAKKTINHFRKNRQAVQNSVEDLGFIMPLTAADLPLSIIEDKAEAGKLKTVYFENIPVQKDTIRPQSWVVDLETKLPLLGAPPLTRTTEKAILFFSCNNLYVLMVEMKNSIKLHGGSGLNAIQEKLEHTIGRISLLLPLYIFNYMFNDIEIKYIGVICYNHDSVDKIENEAKKSELYKILKGELLKNKQKRIYLETILGGTYHVPIHFVKNKSGNMEEFTIDLEDVFMDDSDFEFAEYSEFTFPPVELNPKP